MHCGSRDGAFKVLSYYFNGYRNKDVISKIDPQAFLTFTDTNAVYGEGFRENFGASVFKKRKK